MNPNPAKLAGFDLEDKATNEILPNWQDFKLLGYTSPSISITFVSCVFCFLPFGAISC